MQTISNSPSKVMVCYDVDANISNSPSKVMVCYDADANYIKFSKQCWLVVSTPLKNISQWEGLSHIFWKITSVWNHQPEYYDMSDMFWCWCWFLLVRIAGFNLAPCSLGRKTNQSTDTTQVPWQVIRHVRGLFQQEALSMFFHPGRVPRTNPFPLLINLP